MKLLGIVFLLLGFICTPVFALDKFQTEQSAQEHCPKDVVVWLNIPTGIFHFKGQRWFGNTKSGAYVCKKEAQKEGDRASKNGQ